MDFELFIRMQKGRLNRLKHIKKYNHIRKIHREVIDSMIGYLLNDKYDIDPLFKSLEEADGNGKLSYIELDIENPDDATIMCDLFIYKTKKEVPSITEIYLDKKKFKIEEKIELLKAMNNSFASLFKIVDVNREEGYVCYEDVFTDKRYNVIDVSLSITHIVDEKNPFYMYNRLITYDGITFGTGIHCMLTGENKKLNEYLKEKRYEKECPMVRCLSLYLISKEEKRLRVSYNGKYGNR